MTMPGGTWTIGRAAFEGLTGMLAGVPGGGDALALPTEPGSLNPCVLFSSGPSKKLKLNSLPASNDTSGVRVSGAGALPRPALSDWSILKTSIVRRGNGDNDGDRAPRNQLRSPFAYSTLNVIRFASVSDVWSLSFVYGCLSSLARLFLNRSFSFYFFFFFIYSYFSPFRKISRSREDSIREQSRFLRIPSFEPSLNLLTFVWITLTVCINRTGRKLRKRLEKRNTIAWKEEKKKNRVLRKRKKGSRVFTFSVPTTMLHTNLIPRNKAGTHPATNRANFKTFRFPLD